jgi:RNA polymerase sigma-70 factor, ECF subfamily
MRVPRWGRRRTKDSPRSTPLTDSVAVLAENDKALVERMLAGDELAFDGFFARYFPGLYRFALVRMGDDAEAAEEVVQGTLSAAVMKLATYRGEAALFSWLCTFCRHEISAYYRRRQRGAAARRLPEDGEEARGVLDSLAVTDQRGPHEALDQQELSRLVRVVLDCLPPHYSSALEWKYLDGLSVVEIAQRMRLGAKAAESLLTRARDSFRDGFASVCGQQAALELGVDHV